MLGVLEAYYGSHCMMDVSQIITLHTVNIYSVVCQVYPNETGRGKALCPEENLLAQVYSGCMQLCFGGVGGSWFWEEPSVGHTPCLLQAFLGFASAVFVVIAP